MLGFEPTTSVFVFAKSLPLDHRSHLIHKKAPIPQHSMKSDKYKITFLLIMER